MAEKPDTAIDDSVDDGGRGGKIDISMMDGTPRDRSSGSRTRDNVTNTDGATASKSNCEGDQETTGDRIGKDIKEAATVKYGSDESFDAICWICSMEGDFKEATNFCTNCNQNLCQRCLRYHDNLLQLKNHTVHAVEAKMSGRTPGSVEIRSYQNCESHGGNYIDIFCPDHDDVCCSTCVALDHKHCEKTVYLPTAAKGFHSNPEVKREQSNMKKTLSKLTEAKKARQADANRIQTEKEESIDFIDKFADDLVNYIEYLRKEEKETAAERYAEFEETIKHDISEIDERISDMEKALSDQTTVDIPDTKLFIHVKQGKKLNATGQAILERVEPCLGQETVRFQPNPGIMDMFSSVGCLGELVQPKVPTLHGEYNVRRKEDKMQCWITDSCVLSDDQILLTDYNNHCLKLLHAGFQLQNSLDLHEPWGVCEVTPGLAAILLHFSAIVQFVDVGSRLVKSKSFPLLEDVGFGTGIATCKDGTAMVVSRNAENANSCVQLYDMLGNLLKTFQNDTASGQPMFVQPGHIITSKHASRTLMYVADWKNGIVTFDENGKLQSAVTDQYLRGVHGLCVGMDKQILVAGCLSHNIVEYDRSGRQKVGILLKKTDGVASPRSLSYDSRTGHLVVTTDDSDIVKVHALTSTSSIPSQWTVLS